MRPVRPGYVDRMSDETPGGRHDIPDSQDPDVPEGVRPTTNQPLHGERRPGFAPLALTLLILAGAVIVIHALTML